MKTHGGLTESLTEQSVRTHVATHDRKGREGKGIGIEDVSPHASSLSEEARLASMHGSLRSLGARWSA